MKGNLLLIVMVVTACATNRPADDGTPGDDNGTGGESLGEHQAPRFTGTDPTDADGDGIADAMDNCPRTFNPIRPMDAM